MTKTFSFNDARKILATFEGSAGELWWRTDGEFAPLTFFVNCNDLFYWGCSDAEEFTVKDIPDLLKAREDMLEVYRAKGDNFECYGELLWCARKRKQRPQKAYYKYFPEGSHALFDACGPVEDQYGTPEWNAKWAKKEPPSA